MTFKEFEKHLKDIKYTVNGDWDISLSYDAKPERVQKLIDICREHLILDWHVIHGEVTEEIPEPDIRIYWDRRG